MALQRKGSSQEKSSEQRVNKRGDGGGFGKHQQRSDQQQEGDKGQQPHLLTDPQKLPEFEKDGCFAHGAKSIRLCRGGTIVSFSANLDETA